MHLALQFLMAKMTKSMGTQTNQNSTCSKLDSKPPCEGHDRVMVHMEEGDLAVLFSQHKENLLK